MAKQYRGMGAEVLLWLGYKSGYNAFNKLPKRRRKAVLLLFIMMMGLFLLGMRSRFPPASMPEEYYQQNNQSVHLNEAAFDMLADCEDFECIQRIHTLTRGKTRFNFPHFFLIGWQKCATTSINLHLRAHPEYLPSIVKESHFFTVCRNFPTHHYCMAHNTSHYIRDFLRSKEAAASRLNKVSADASVDYAWRALLADEIRQLFPWIKIVVVLREPISRLISYIRMYTQRNDSVKGCLGGRSMYDCLMYHLDPKETNSNYSVPMEAWLSAFPKSDQVHIIQFEELQENADQVARNLKVFLGMDPNFPKKQLYNTNLRRSGGYPMTREEYVDVIRRVEWDVDKISNLLAHRGLAHKDVWLKRWKDVWKRNLDSCDPVTGMCMVNSN